MASTSFINNNNNNNEGISITRPPVFDGMLGKEFSEEEIVDKVLWSLTPKWDGKITVIEEGRNFNTLTYDQLRGNLLAYEVKYLNHQGEEEKKKKGLTLRA
ncbi:hypothetical protein PIB30_090063 [Stylosanthes scabra]|uniref:Uncharacterized protein n=1 Tax=Stylosanthes scabra TaxID=79078 RepID=A0ABU6SWJ3_9FABA|nr:hypothetical protein [Stylosanthes scabra]